MSAPGHPSLTPQERLTLAVVGVFAIAMLALGPGALGPEPEPADGAAGPLVTACSGSTLRGIPIETADGHVICVDSAVQVAWPPP